MRLLLLCTLLAACSQNQKGDVKDPVVAGTDDTAAIDSGNTGDSGGTTDTATTDSVTTDPPVDADGDGYTVDDDCDDNDDTVHPGAEELCNGRDDDCDGRSDADDDNDGDGLADCEDYCPVYAAWGAGGDGRYIDPVSTIQEAVDLAGTSGCNEVRAFQGTYYENVNWNGYPVNAESLSGPETTIIDGQALDSVIRFVSAESEDARVFGFTLTNGGGDAGAGIEINASSPVVEGNLIVGNATTAYNHLGGGILTVDGSPTIIDNEISGNNAGLYGDENGCDGGGINIRRGSPYISGNYIVDNTAGDGGGIWTAYADATIVNNVISGNIAVDNDLEAGGQGGGINVQIAGPTETLVVANLITDNIAGMFGGGVVTYEDNSSYAEARFENNVIAYNEVTDTELGAGICQYRRTTPTFVNNLIFGNKGVGVYSEDDIDATYTYNGVWLNETDYDGLSGSGTGNVSVDPRFTDATDDGDWSNDDWSLRGTSPAIDAGDPAILDVDGSRSDLGGFGGVEGGW